MRFAQTWVQQCWLAEAHGTTTPAAAPAVDAHSAGCAAHCPLAARAIRGPSSSYCCFVMHAVWKAPCGRRQTQQGTHATSACQNAGVGGRQSARPAPTHLFGQQRAAEPDAVLLHVALQLLHLHLKRVHACALGSTNATHGEQQRSDSWSAGGTPYRDVAAKAHSVRGKSFLHAGIDRLLQTRGQLLEQRVSAGQHDVLYEHTGGQAGKRCSVEVAAPQPSAPCTSLGGCQWGTTR